jgi:hypothetical protein
MSITERNLSRDPRCVISVATDPFDLVIEGAAERVTSTDELSSVAESYVRSGWPAGVTGDAPTAECGAPSAGPAPWYVYRVKPVDGVCTRHVGASDWLSRKDELRGDWTDVG